MKHFLKSGRAVAAVVTLVAVSGFAACSNLKNDLLEAPDPDIIDPSSVQSANGANAVRVGALGRLRLMTVGTGNAGTEGTWLIGGLLADEWSTSSTFVQNDEIDERQTSTSNSTVTGSLRAIYRTSTSATQAIQLLNKYRPAPASDIAEMYFARAFAYAQLASDFCNGIPIDGVDGTTITLGKPLSVVEVFNLAAVSYDSAIAASTGTDAASVAINRAAKIGKARALLGSSLTNAAAAAALVNGIPTTYSYDVTSSSVVSGNPAVNNNNGVYQQGLSQRRYSLGDSVEGNARSLLVANAIPFYSANDPRLPANYTISSKGDTTKGQDGLTYSRTTPIYGQFTSMSVVNGIDARLVEAEAALQAGNAALMISTLNGLRATALTLGAVTYNANALPALTDPGSADGRINLLFREKAFWTFTRGQRLNELRRLIRQYGRTPAQTFPTGNHYRGTTYHDDVNLPITVDEANGNINFANCTDRKA